MPRIPYPSAFPPPSGPTPPTLTTLPAVISALTSFLLAGPTTVLTGAGLSTASGLTDYRGENGTYRTRPNFRPVLLSDFLGSERTRKRYWSRSFLGQEEFSSAKVNKGHLAIARLVKAKVVNKVITQNVDSLHLKAWYAVDMPSVEIPTAPELPEHLVELHGTLRNVACYSCGASYPGQRAGLQEYLKAKNPFWEELKHSGRLIQGPDGDVAPPPGITLPDFHLPPPCESCGGLYKPGIVFFGENVPVSVREAAEEALKESGRVMVIGSSLATLSAWRLVRDVSLKDKEAVAVVTKGGARDEAVFFADGKGIRTEWDLQEVLAGLLDQLEKMGVVS